MAVSKRLRFEIMRRDNHACRYCGAGAPDAKLTIDHVVAVTLGGTDLPDNLVTACVDCNSGKASTTADAETVADVAQDALRWSEAMRLASVAADAESEARALRHGEFVRAWSAVLIDWRGDPRPLPADFRTSVDQFWAAGATEITFYDAISAAAAARPDNHWRYFCGVMWRKVAALQEAARSILSAEDTDGA